MAKKKPSPKRNNNWMQLKSVLWKEYKDEGLYDWNSQKFNQLVSATYEATGKKDPAKVARIGLVAKGVEEALFNQAIATIYQIPYYDIGKTLEAFRDDPTYTGYKVITQFKTPEFTDEKFKVDNFDYDGSQFQEMVKRVDKERSSTPTSSPPAKINVEVNPDKKTIRMYVGAEEPLAPGEVKKEKAKKPAKAYNKITATPATVKSLREELNENKERIKTLEYRLDLEKTIVIPLIQKGGSGFDEYILESTLNLKEWSRELRKLEKENEGIKKQLSKQGKGFLAKSRKGKKRK